MKKILYIFGTRPEIIKLFPLITVFEKKTQFNQQVLHTGQHSELADQVIEFFSINVSSNLHLMTHNQTLHGFCADAIRTISEALESIKPDLVFVQGDTTTAFAGALAAFYRKIKVAHVEAGLRSFNKYAPFPEEINRKLISEIADFHFAPTEQAVEHLKNAGVTNNVWNVGNTVIDALFLTLGIIKRQGEDRFNKRFQTIDFSKKIVLITCHRRENFGEPFEQVCSAIAFLAKRYSNFEFVYPVHPNPHIRENASRLLKSVSNVHCIDPLDYPSLVWLMNKSFLILTDSGGIQEEAPSLGKPVLVLREVTERMEGVTAGNALLVGTDKEKIVKEAVSLIENEHKYQEMVAVKNPYGDGTTSEQIATILETIL